MIPAQEPKLQQVFRLLGESLDLLRSLEEEPTCSPADADCVVMTSGWIAKARIELRDRFDVDGLGSPLVR